MTRVFHSRESFIIGISMCLRRSVTSFLVPIVAEKTSKITGVPAGQRIFLTASLAVFACMVSPSTACMISHGKMPASWAGEPGRTPET